ncbi:MAG: carboxypeptidase regulatory-like domain-containing protein [Endomicrobium sp.]|jgi:protocatechuate 3,4-dioxygenase beta subunit|nr:carboxypeptidase regulatory-like domain-containing protein [Endomicrobium sp.]
MKKLLSLCFALLAAVLISPVCFAEGFQIMGFITDAEGNPLSDVAVKITGDADLTEKSDPLGYYKFENLKKGLRLELSVDAPGYKFKPEVHKIKKLNSDEYADFEVQPADEPKSGKKSEEKFKINGVISEKGIGISGVTVEVVSGRKKYKAETDADGYYEVFDLPPGRDFVIRPYKDSLLFVPAEIAINNPVDDKVVNFNVSDQRFYIAGKVTDADKKPLNSAKVSVSAPDNKFITLVDEEDGTYMFVLPSGAAYAVRAFKDGYHAAEVQLSNLSNNMTVDFSLEIETESKESQVFFEVAKKEAEDPRIDKKAEKQREKEERAARKEQERREKEAKKEEARKAKEAKNAEEKALAAKKPVKIRGAIANKKFAAENISVVLDPGGHQTFTDSKGRYSFEIIPEADEYFLKPQSEDVSFDPEVVSIKDFKKPVYDFNPYVTFEGYVFDNRRPVRAATVNLNGVEVEKTDNFGRFKINAQYGVPVQISVSKEGYMFYPPEISFEKAEKNRMQLDFVSVFLVSGKMEVQDRRYSTGDFQIEVTGSTNSIIQVGQSGNYTIPGLAAGGNYKITPKTGGYISTPKFREFLNLDRNITNQNFTLAKETYTVKGNVNVGGKPVVNAIITASRSPLRYFTDSNGDFEIRDLDYGGPYTFSVQTMEYRFDPIVIETLDKNTQIEFSNDIVLSGIVRSGDIAVPGVTVEINGERYKTGEDGRFSVKANYGKDYTVYLSGNGMSFEPQEKEYRRVEQNITNEVFEASVIISGKVTGDGKPLAGASVTLNYGEVYKTDENGYYLIRNVAMGRDYVLEVSHPGYRFSTAKKELSEVMSGKMAEDFSGRKINK